MVHCQSSTNKTNDTQNEKTRDRDVYLTLQSLSQAFNEVYRNSKYAVAAIAITILYDFDILLWLFSAVSSFFLKSVH